jgi:hypothetical protein
MFSQCLVRPAQYTAVLQQYLVPRPPEYLGVYGRVPAEVSPHTVELTGTKLAHQARAAAARGISSLSDVATVSFR